MQRRVGFICLQPVVSRAQSGGPAHCERHDANGNRTQKIVNGGTGTYGYTDYYGVDGRDRLWWVNRRNIAPTTGQADPYTIFNYDENGRVSYRERRHDASTPRKLALIWDSDDRLKRVWQNDGTNVTSIFNGLYDEDGLRVQKTDAWTGSHDYSWGPGGIVHDTAGTSYTPGLHQQAGGTDRFFHSDWLGSTRYLSDSAGTGLPSTLRYDAFGNRSATGGTDAFHSTEFQFGGGWGYQQEFASATEPGLGLQYLEQRYYDPAVGRFISPDPIGLAGGLNLYGYVDGDAVNGVDPSGLRGVQIGNVMLGWGEPDLVFTGEGTALGLRTGLAATASSFTWGRYDGGEYRNQPGFATSECFATVGREVLVAAANAKAAQVAGTALARVRIPRFLLKSRPGRIRLPGGGRSGGTYTLRDRTTGQVARTGRTNDLVRREVEHARDPQLGKYRFEVDRRIQDSKLLRAREHVLDTEIHPNTPLNKIRAMDPRKVKQYQPYIDAARKL